MDDFQKMVIELRSETMKAVLDGLRNEPTPGWATIARGLLNDYRDILDVADDAVSQETLDVLNDITEQLRLSG